MSVIETGVSPVPAATPLESQPLAPCNRNGNLTSLSMPDGDPGVNVEAELACVREALRIIHDPRCPVLPSRRHLAAVVAQLERFQTNGPGWEGHMPVYLFPAPKPEPRTDDREQPTHHRDSPCDRCGKFGGVWALSTQAEQRRGWHRYRCDICGGHWVVDSSD